MHHIYHTQGFILSSRNVGEANKIFSIYTRELGLIRGVAQGVRLHKSKLRFALQEFSCANIDLVKGRDIWRVTSARHISSFSQIKSDHSSLVLIMRTCKLLERLSPGEIANESIFDDLIQVSYLLDDTDVRDDYREALELYLVLRIMKNLGYIGESKILDRYLDSSFGEDKIENLLKERKSIISHINKALFESQL